MKQLFIIITTFLFLTSLGQSREITIEIQQIESVNSNQTDSIKIELTNQGFLNMGEPLVILTQKSNDRISISQLVNIQSDSTTLKVYFNKYGFVEIDNLDFLNSDTLLISNFTIYPDCEQKGTWFRKTIFENDAEGEIDLLNYEEEVQSEFDIKKSECSVPYSMNLRINGLEYINEVEKQTTSGLITTGHGYKRKFWFGSKRYFHFRKEELYLIRKVKIELK